MDTKVYISFIIILHLIKNIIMPYQNLDEIYMSVRLNILPKKKY
jgi:hypothetical protein